MANDPYERVAERYDRAFESMNAGLRRAGLKLFQPTERMHILDVGCGTGAQLDLYRPFGCHLYGLDMSPAMLQVANRRFKGVAALELGNATAMPYTDNQFDLITSMLALHEMRPETRSAVVAEMKRTLKPGGRILLIDYHPGPYRPLQGWLKKAFIVLAELAAGREHFRNYRHSMRTGGLPTLIAEQALTIEKQRIVAGGNFMICLLT